ncbi:MAG: hypothetical protein JWN40_5528, partial [Phycisphaerales bacterium]|nr:hypothetical protein [Phycisphaerales bacterium]
CVSAWSGAQALGRLASGEVDVVVTDLNMAVGDGITLIETIRKTSPVAVIVVSGFAAQYAQRALAFENVSVLPKPLDTAALLALVRARLIEAWQSRQASRRFNEAVAIG